MITSRMHRPRPTWPKGDAEGVDDAHVGDRVQHTGADEGRGADGLHTDDEVADAHDQRLADGERREEEEAAEVGLAHGDVFDALGVDLDAEDHHEHEGADPQRQFVKSAAIADP